LNGGDYTVHVVVGVDPEGRMYLLDLWRKQASSDEWVEAFCSLVKEWKPREWAEEQGQIKAGVGPFIERMQRERQAFVYRRTFPTRGDKAVRARKDRLEGRERRGQSTSMRAKRSNPYCVARRMGGAKQYPSGPVAALLRAPITPIRVSSAMYLE